MKKILMGSGLAAAVAALALAPAAGASQGPNNTLDGSAGGSQSGDTILHWTADVPGTFGGVSTGGILVTEDATKVITNSDGSTSTDYRSEDIVRAIGASGPFAGAPSSLQPAGTVFPDGYTGDGYYTLHIYGGGAGAIGSVTGQPGLD